jgi:hypothetical protein
MQPEGLGVLQGQENSQPRISWLLDEETGEF